jgi:putative endopeptidase
MKNRFALCPILAFLLCASTAFSQSKGSDAQPALPYSPSLDLSSMDRSIDPCVDLYHYSCGGWQKKNPIPPDQTSWSVYGKLYQDNLNYLRTILEQASSSSAQRNAVTQKIGDFYGACMDESAAEKRGLSGLQPELDEIARLKSVAELTSLTARLQLTFNKILFDGGSEQDPDNSDQVIAGLPAACPSCF